MTQPPVAPLAGGPFDSALAKLNRAMEHRDPFYALIESAVHDGLACGWGEYDSKKLCHVWEVKQVGRVPTQAGPILGEIVHGLHSALDNLTWALVKLGHTPSLTHSQRRNVQFPLYESANAFDEDAHGRMPGVLDEDRAILKKYQPYNKKKPPLGHPFSYLNDLSRIDKHRVINPIVSGAMSLGFQYWPTTAPMKIMLQPGDSVDVGTEILRIQAEPEAQVRVKGHLLTAIAFEDGVSVPFALKEIYLGVLYILGEFAERYGEEAGHSMPPTE